MANIVGGMPRNSRSSMCNGCHTRHRRADGLDSWDGEGYY